MDIGEERHALDAVLLREFVSGSNRSSRIHLSGLGKQFIMCAQRKIVGIVFLHAICYVTVGTFARCGLSSTAKTLRSLSGVRGSEY